MNIAPKFNEHDMGFVDLEAEYFLGSYVVARLDNNQATFKQLII
ncbi:hypothetical protein P20652_4121 [Pseudoalteromonas sp. BSi20652]|nr:hypothetical protein P20652_4121 [Pseudoalteromonas sp. BSi20652]